MINRRKSVFNWNHISEDIESNDINELKSYYRTYHKKSWAFKRAMRKYKKYKLIGNAASILLASGGIASAIASGGIALVAVSSGALIIKCVMDHYNLDMKIQNCTYAFQSYDHLLISIKNALRSGEYNMKSITDEMNNIDNYVTDNSPVMDKFFKDYEKKFTSE